MVVGFLFPFFIGWLLPFIFDHGTKQWTIFVGLPLIILGIFSPYHLKYLYNIWISIGNYLAFFNSYIILGSVFVLVLVPISFIMKLFKYDPLKLRKESLKTYREIRKDSKIYLEKIF